MFPVHERSVTGFNAGTNKTEVDLHELCERGDAECVWILLSQAILLGALRMDYIIASYSLASLVNR